MCHCVVSSTCQAARMQCSIEIQWYRYDFSIRGMMMRTVHIHACLRVSIANDAQIIEPERKRV